MNDNFTDRLLDASLREYSRVSPPDGFAAGVLSKDVARRPARGWLWVPAAAALACGILGGILIARPMAPAPPAVAVFHPSAIPVVRSVEPSRLVAKGKQVAVRVDAPFHTLTGVELASMTLPPELFAQREEKPIADVVISPLTIAPLEIPTIPDPEGVKQK
jgi:hypothetical protein